MAEVDDADGFGDFSFATAVDPNPKINGAGRVSAVSDDDWGDFVTTDSTTQIKSQPFVPSNGPFDPFGFFNVANGSPPTRPESEPIRVETEPEKVDKARWEKPRRALPLSLFGEELEEEDSGDDGGESNLSKSEGFVKKETNLNASSIGINDLIANLYGQNPKIRVENGSNSNLGSGGSDSAEKGLNFSANALDLKFDELIPNGNGKYGGLDLDSNGVDLKFDGIDSNSNASGVKSNLEEGNGDFDEDDDDDGWEFKTAESEQPASNENLKEQGVVEVAGPKVESNAYIHPGIQVDERRHENPGGSGFTWGFGIDSPQVNNVLAPSLGSSHGNGEWGFSFDFNPSPVPHDNFFLDLHSMSKQNNAGNVSSASPVDGNEWGFKDAFSETGSERKLEEAKPVIPDGLELHSLDGVSARAHSDFFGGSDGISQKSHENNFAFPLIPNSGTKDYVIPDSYSSGKKDDIAKELSYSLANDHAELDDNCWEFKDAFSESGSKLETEVTLDTKRQALPLSIFGDEELETDDSSIPQDIYNLTAASHQINTARGPPSNISITDLISSLYSEVDQNTNTIRAPNATEDPVHPAPMMLESDYGDDDFDDDSWEFKDAISKDQDQHPVTDLEYSSQDSLTKVELDNFVDFYCKLKYELYFLALNHLDNKKKAQSSAVLSGEDTAEALEEEIQKLYHELHQDGMIPDQSQSGNPSQRNLNLNEVHRALQDPQFQVLESEFQLSERLSLAEEDLRSAIELLRHAASTLEILRLGLPEEQSSYISTWSQIASICAQELKHGSLIWTNSIENNVQTQILSDPQGKQYILALGEIYRVVLVVGASAKLCKPWTLLHSSDCSSLFALLNECSTLWSSSRLGEALKSISDEIDFKYDGTINELLDSMMYTQHLDAAALQNHVANGQQPKCSLSLLTAGVVPGIKMVMWNGKHYLLTLANLWINLISPDPPQLPHLSYS